MKTQRRLIICALLWCVLPLAALAEDAILPHGDPRLRDTDMQQQEEIRDNRLKQQGQGLNYRVEGQLQGGQRGARVDDPNGLTSQDTGLSDPSVNPGQASDMEVVRGKVKQANPKIIIVEERNGKETTMSVDGTTEGDRDVRPGDVITGRITKQGLAIAIHKDTVRGN
jgi:hypothetical protein